MTTYYSKLLIKPFRAGLWKKYIHLFLILFVFISYSCKDEEFTLGLNIQSGKDKTQLREFETDSVLLNTIKAKPIETSNLNYALLGNLYDTDFGLLKCDFLTEFSTEKDSIIENIDSVTNVTLALYSDAFFGDTTDQEMIIKVYPLINKLDDSLKSNSLTGQYFDVTNMLNSVTVPVNYAKQKVLISLPAEFFNPLFTKVDSIKGYDDLIKHFKGLYITSKTNQSNGILRRISLNSVNTYLKISCKTNDTIDTDYYLVVDTFCNRLIRYSIHNTEDIIEHLKDEVDTEYSYIQSLGGLNTMVTLPDLNWLKDSMPLVINKASLTIKAAPYLYKKQNLTSNIVIQDTANILLEDYNSNNYVSISKTGWYNIILTRQLNDYLFQNSSIPLQFILTPQIQELYYNPSGVKLLADSIQFKLIYHKLSN